MAFKPDPYSLSDGFRHAAPTQRSDAPLGVGDIAQLKSGSPSMTIEKIVGETANVIFYVGAPLEFARYELPMSVLARF